MQDIIVIVGPTGVGKTKLSIALAKLIDAEIINADSVSIYKELNIGSAKVTLNEMDGVIHHLISIKSITEDYSIYDYQQDVRALITDITKRNKRVIIVGGSGLYIKSALFNYELSTGTANKDYADLTNLEIYNKLKTYDPTITIHINNRVRLVRTLNKYENNEVIGKDKNNLLYPITVIGLTTPRYNLYEIINKRVDTMLTNGLLKEVTTLKDYYPTSKVLNTAIGYKEWLTYFNNKSTLAETVALIKKDSRHYAKRQYTFFKHQFNTTWIDVNYKDFDMTIKEVITYLQKKKVI